VQSGLLTTEPNFTKPCRLLYYLMTAFQMHRSQDNSLLKGW